MSISNSLFGSSEFSLRLPNVMAFILYLAGCFLIFRSTKNNWLVLFGFSLALLNPFLLEFFSLARGYGISLAFMLLSIYFLIRNLGKPHIYPTFVKDFICAVILAACSAYSNLIMLNFLIAVIFFFALRFLLFPNKDQRKSKYRITFLIAVFLSLILIVPAMNHLLKLKDLDQLYFGASNFIKGFDQLVFQSIEQKEYISQFSLVIKILLISSLSIGLFSVLVKKEYDGPLFFMILLALMLISALTLEHFLFSTKFPIGRTALFYIPIIAVLLYHLLLHLLNHYKIKKSIYITIIFFMTFPLVLNFIAHANFKKTSVWYYDAHTKNAMETIKTKTQNRNYTSTISNHWLFEPTINYYISKCNLNLDAANRNGIKLNTDFIFKLDDQEEEVNYKILHKYEDPQTCLLMKIGK